ncbi:2-amino-4-hydroxy-6-hydroxymethyldihydropteridine diphosphokinase [uncultured Psychrobacter sp.]|uniref:2-amino-4-hydroxy-6- hydroxymethyldihydropteridine diphosphokinase n=1 Tax=uncultured Psychrobacter sp. TaxID=259303 RepID=UPI00345A0050
MNLKALKRCSPESLQQQTIAAVLLALGSNHQADYYLPQVRKKLAALGQIQLSTPFQNPDFTATFEQPKPDYTNQCVYLSLAQSMTLKQLQQILKQFENDCNRQRSSKLTKKSIKIVTMDIDILLIKPSIAKNSLSKNLESNCKHKDTREWIIMADRYPFKAHEVIGIEELALTRKTNNDR